MKAGVLLSPGQFTATLSQPSTTSIISLATGDINNETRVAIEDCGMRLAQYTSAKDSAANALDHRDDKERYACTCTNN